VSHQAMPAAGTEGITRHNPKSVVDKRRLMTSEVGFAGPILQISKRKTVRILPSSRPIACSNCCSLVLGSSNGGCGTSEVSRHQSLPRVSPLHLSLRAYTRHL
jgi:hypothetical protein